MTNIYGVQFKTNGEIIPFLAENIECPINVTVIVSTARGELFGKVVSQIKDMDINKIDTMNKIIRISTKGDYKKYLEILKEQEQALVFAAHEAKKLNLPMNFLDANFTFDKKQLLIKFMADERVDFRELAKRLAGKYRMRIELRQIGARDKAKEVGGYGVCGQKLCCSSFLKHIDSVTMTMAKNQNIALNPSKINGCCGRLLCCLTYEDEQYSENRVGMPNVGQKVSTEYGEGRVILVDILNRKYKVMIDNDVKEIELGKNEGSKE